MTAYSGITCALSGDSCLTSCALCLTVKQEPIRPLDIMAVGLTLCTLPAQPH
jgi:hypothetical protein